MPSYQAIGENTPVKLLQRGIPAYAIGKKANTPSFLFQVTKVTVLSNVVTINVILKQGLLPFGQTDLVGQLIYVTGTSVGSGEANCQGAPITAVSIDTTTGIGTISYGLVASNLSAIADSGQAVIKPNVIPENIEGPSQAFAIQNTLGGSYGLTWDLSGSGTFSCQLEGAISNDTNDYALIGTAETGAGVFVAQVPNLVNFVRLNVTSGELIGGIGRLLLS